VPDLGQVEPTQAFSVGTWVRPHLRPLESKDEEKPTGVILSAADAGQNQRGWQLNVAKASFSSSSPHRSDNAHRGGNERKSLRRGPMESRACHL